jgi:hypothetical protein
VGGSAKCPRRQRRAGPQFQPGTDSSPGHGHAPAQFGHAARKSRNATGWYCNSTCRHGNTTGSHRDATGRYSNPEFAPQRPRFSGDQPQRFALRDVAKYHRDSGLFAAEFWLVQFRFIAFNFREHSGKFGGSRAQRHALPPGRFAQRHRRPYLQVEKS